MDISFIVPLYKGKKYISHIIKMTEENLRVLKENKRDAEIEIIFINDFPDEEINHTELMERQGITFSLLKNTHNLGIHRSRINGLTQARGKYVVFLDQDDEISPFYLYRQMNCIEGADAVLCNGVYRGNRVIYQNIDQQRQAVMKDNYIRKGNIIISPGQVLLKKDAVPDIWMKHILVENGSDDVLLWVLMLCQGKRFLLNPYADYIHKEDGKNTSLNFQSMKQSIEELLEVVKTEELLEKEDFVQFEEGIKNRIYKYNRYIEILCNWNKILKSIIELIQEQNYRKIALYGYGVIGKKLLSDFEKENISLTCIIDKAEESFESSPYPIYGLKHLPEDIELIILTPIFDEKQIRKELSDYNGRIISLLSL